MAGPCAKAAASQTREGKTGLREQPQIKVQTRVRVSLFVREMHGPWIWPAEVAAAHVKAEVRHLATRIDGQAASCFGGLQATRIKLRRHWYCVLRRRRRWRVREPRAALRLATPPWRIGRFRTGGFVPGFASFSGSGFFVTETAIFLTLRVCGLRAGLTSNPRRAEPVIKRVGYLRTQRSQMLIVVACTNYDDD